MIATPEQLIASTQANVHTLKSLTTHALTKLEKLVKLNAGLSKTLMTGAFSHTQELLDMKNPQQLLAQQVEMIKPLGEKSSAYAWEMYAIAFEAGSELNKVAEVKRAEVQTWLFEAMEEFAKSVPMSSESAITALKNAMKVGQDAILSAQGSAKKAAELAETSFASMKQPVVEASTAKAH